MAKGLGFNFISEYINMHIHLHVYMYIYINKYMYIIHIYAVHTGT